MPTHQIFTNYIPAQVADGKTTRVYYYVKHPITNKLTRVVIKCNRITSKRIRLEFARKIAVNINEKLAQGYNPFLAKAGEICYTKLIDATALFLKEKKKELRTDSIRSYISMGLSFTSWLKNSENENMYCVSFSKKHAYQYLESIYARDKMSNNTWNNYLKFARCLFNWLIEREYCLENHFTKIQVKKKEDKKREIFSSELKLRLKVHLSIEDPYFWAICTLCYGCLIRPKEILSLKANDFMLNKRLVRIPAKVAKNGKERLIAMPDVVVEALHRIGIEKVEDDKYIFSKGWKPGKIQMNTRDIGRYWQNLRKEIDLPKEISFYSLKDTGISDALDLGISPKVVQQHADHSSLKMTEKYNHANFDLYRETIIGKFDWVFDKNSSTLSKL